MASRSQASPQIPFSLRCVPRSMGGSAPLLADVAGPHASTWQTVPSCPQALLQLRGFQPHPRQLCYVVIPSPQGGAPCRRRTWVLMGSHPHHPPGALAPRRRRGSEGQWPGRGSDWPRGGGRGALGTGNPAQIKQLLPRLTSGRGGLYHRRCWERLGEALPLPLQLEGPEAGPGQLGNKPSI